MNPKRRPRSAANAGRLPRRGQRRRVLAWLFVALMVASTFAALAYTLAGSAA